MTIEGKKPKTQTKKANVKDTKSHIEFTPNQPQGKTIGYKGIYNPKNEMPFRVSRSKIELFINCPRCFWLETKKGIKQPPGFPFNINSAIDQLFKNEFDALRKVKEPHPIFQEYQIGNIIPYNCSQIDVWREAFIGIQYLHKPTNLLIFGGVDDIWLDLDQQNLIVVDYKSTAKEDDIVALDAPWHAGYKRQLEMYSWMLESLGLPINKKSYWVYANGIANKPAFNNIVEFRTTLIEYQGKTNWIEPTLFKIKEVLNSDDIPPVGESCEFCKYTKTRLALAWQNKK